MRGSLQTVLKIISELSQPYLNKRMVTSNFSARSDSDF